MNAPLAPIAILPMASSDLDAVLTIESALPSAPHWNRDAYVRALDPAGIPRRLALVAAVESTVVGYAVASIVHPQAELETIAVAPSWSRQGIASRLLETVISQLRLLEVSVLELEVRPSNLAATSFYRSHGFNETGRRFRYYSDPVEDAVLMRRNVG